MPNQIKNRILQHLRHRSYQPQRSRAMAKDLGVAPDDLGGFIETIEQLIKSGEAVMGSSDTIALPPMGSEVEGRIKINQRGFGFLIPDTPNSHGDLFIPAGKINGALTGDRVRAEVKYARGRSGGGRSPYTGSVIDILKRANTQFIGVLEKRGKLWVVHVDGSTLNEPVMIRDVTSKNAKAGHKVVIELTHYPEHGYTAEGVITEVLGAEGEPDVETMGICRAFGYELHFEDEVMNEARKIAHEYDEKTEAYFDGRIDLRDQFIMTIDPPDAKDYDDAISIKYDQGEWELGIHIADVSTFVTTGSVLDTEASQRGNSVYLPRLVIPMLPEILSNGICSLQADVPRLTKSAFVRYDPKGKVIGRRFANTIIQSRYRLTYLEAQALIDGDKAEAAKHAKSENDYSDELITALHRMNDLAKIIRRRRQKQGMISLDLPEVELIFDEDGHVVDAQPEDNAYTHTIIEMFMVEANEAVAGVFSELDVPLIRRVHPDPGAQDITQLRQFARVAGYNIPANPTRHELQTLLDAVRGKPAAKAVHLAVLKTLTQATYSPALIGHFALASTDYAHFTSPIRRYPDLLVHRQIAALFDLLGDKPVPKSKNKRKTISEKLQADDRCLLFEELEEVGKSCTGTERNAQAAERELRNVLVLMLLQKHVGEVFDSTCTGVTSFGAFFQIDKYLVEGLIRTTRLPGAPAERYKLDDTMGCLVAQRSGRRITIGDQFKVKITKVNIAQRELDLEVLIDSNKKRQVKPKKEKLQRTKQARRGKRNRR